MADCADSQMRCEHGEPQEACIYGDSSIVGHRPGMPCDWGNLSALCTSQLASCVCSQPTAGIATSAIPTYATTPFAAAMIYIGSPLMLWGLTLIVYPLFRLLTQWTRTYTLPPSLTTSVSATAFRAWIVLCAVATVALIVLSRTLPADVWGDCARRGVCTYHMMFCEGTRHHSPVRHPANFWSNLPYVYLAIGILVVGADARARSSPRPNQLLDASFGIVLLSMAMASFGWHGSNCTAIHFVDIGLMNCVIAFFPYRFIAASAVAAAGGRVAHYSTPICLGFWAILASQAAWAADQTDQFHAAFPTGHSRMLTLQPIEILLYLSSPGLYPLPFLARMAQRRTWGCVPALVVSVLALPLGFCFHASERVVLDLYCDPFSLAVQPTAIFHVFTAIAIGGAYVQSHAIEGAGADEAA